MSAQLASFTLNALGPSKPSRATQLLPAVKCSQCGEEVSLSDLGDHDRVCSPKRNNGPPPRTMSKSPGPAPSASPSSGSTADRLNRFRQQQQQQQPRASPTSPSSNMRDPFAPGPLRRPTPDGQRDRDRYDDRSPRDAPRQLPPSASTPPSRPARTPPIPTSASVPPPRGPTNNGPEPGRFIPPPMISSAPREPASGDGGGNMAGVGRRAFAAAAQAALFTSNMARRQEPPENREMNGGRSAEPPRDLRQGRGPYAELDSLPDRGTPPLSPNSPYSPVYSPASPQSPREQYPSNRLPAVARSRTPSPSRPRSRSPSFKLPSATASVKSPASVRSGSVSSKGTGSSAALPYSADKHRNGSISSSSSKISPVESRGNDRRPPAIRTPSKASSKSSRSGFSSGSEAELSYARYGEPDDEDDEEETPRVPEKDSIRFPSTTASSPPEPRSLLTKSRSGSSASQSSSSSYTTLSVAPSRTHSKSTPTLDRSVTLPSAITRERERDLPRSPMTPLMEEPLSDDSLSPTQAKYPTRSLTSPSLSKSSSGITTRRAVEKTCVTCGIKIKNGKWIAIPDGDGVLCEKDWKNMYLPKCRRCNLPIESKAVSSADGQLKGKYHKECFNCHACHKPFPDKTFYIFGGRPYCAYHYHLSNKSLCSQPSCGNPIEGRCAEDDEGRRYHQNCFTCDENDCGERLDEYWEVENGKRICEKCWRKFDDERSEYSRGGSDDGNGNGNGNGRVRGLSVAKGQKAPGTSRAMKRRTRMVDLSGLGGL